MNTYKLRAECAKDLERLSVALVRAGAKATVEAEQDGQFPDCEAVIRTALSLDDLRAIIDDIPDGHVMSDTVQTVEQYDGLRTQVIH